MAEVINMLALAEHRVEEIDMYSLEELLEAVVVRMENKIDSFIEDIAEIKTKVNSLSDKLEKHMDDEDAEIGHIKQSFALHTADEKRNTNKAKWEILAGFVAIATTGVSALIYFAPGLAKILLHLIGG